MDVELFRREDGRIYGGRCVLLVEHRLVAQTERKGMGSGHRLAEAGKVFHLIALTDGIIHQQAIVGKVVFVHGLKDSWE